VHLSRELLATLEGLLPQATAPQPAPPPPPQLGHRMRQFLQLLCHPEGYTYKEIAHRMRCSTSTLSTYRGRLRKRFGIRGKAALVRWALLNGLA
jgi:DNA-binding NarL/FixJ family response regulator